MLHSVLTASQLSAHLRSLRKARGLTQAQLGQLIGVRQVRIAEIEANPGVVSIEQMLQVLHHLGARLSLQASPNPPRERAPPLADDKADW